MLSGAADFVGLGLELSVPCLLHRITQLAVHVAADFSLINVDDGSVKNLSHFSLGGGSGPRSG
jgi:hypothetical protein